MTLLFDIGLIITGMLAKYFLGENWVISTTMTKGLTGVSKVRNRIE